MEKTDTFRIEKMDCPSEERLIRLRFEALAGIKGLDFDLKARMLKVTHSMDDSSAITRLLQEMGLPGQPVREA